MTQLSNDCFYSAGQVMTISEALTIIKENVTVLAEPKSTTLTKAINRILAEDIISAANVPPHSNSAVDGYAVSFDDLKNDGGTRLPVTERVAAGHPLKRQVKSGEAIRIYTGAVMPEGVDTVLMQEDCREEEGYVFIQPGIKRGANMRQLGEDIFLGDKILQKGKRLRAFDIGLAASTGRKHLSIYSPLRVAIFSTGDELRKPNTPLPLGCIYDSNRYTLIAALTQMGCIVTDLGIIPDREEIIREALNSASKTHDLLVTSGGVSVGDEDHVCSAVTALGKIHFWRLAIRPGRPVALGQIGSTPFVGLPGNPVAAMVTFLIIARPLILKLGGALNIEPTIYQVQAGFDYKKKINRREYIRVSLNTEDDGKLIATKFSRDGAGILSSLVQSDGLVELPENMLNLVAGSMVNFMPFGGSIR